MIPHYGKLECLSTDNNVRHNFGMPSYWLPNTLGENTLGENNLGENTLGENTQGENTLAYCVEEQMMKKKSWKHWHLKNLTDDDFVMETPSAALFTLIFGMYTAAVFLVVCDPSMNKLWAT